MKLLTIYQILYLAFMIAVFIFLPPNYNILMAIYGTGLLIFTGMKELLPPNK